MTASRAAVASLPADLTSFVGRQRELRDVRRLLGASRLVTLTGVGGVGKTRIGLRVAADVRRSFPDGIWFVDLTELRGQVQDVAPGEPDAEGLAYLILDTLGLREQGDGTGLRQLTEQLAARRILLLLDSCEHMVPACAALTHALLQACAGVQVLATSREHLTVAGEARYEVPPLSVPVPGFQLTDDNREAVAATSFRTVGFAMLGQGMWAVFIGAAYTVGAVLSVTLFPTAIHFTATAVALDVGVTLFAGTAPTSPPGWWPPPAAPPRWPSTCSSRPRADFWQRYSDCRAVRPHRTRPRRPPVRRPATMGLSGPLVRKLRMSDI